MFGKQKHKSNPGSSKSVQPQKDDSKTPQKGEHKSSALGPYEKDATKPPGGGTHKKNALIPHEKNATRSPRGSRHSNDNVGKPHDKAPMPTLQATPMPEQILEAGGERPAKTSPWLGLRGPPTGLYSGNPAPYISKDGSNASRYDEDDGSESDDDDDDTVRGHESSEGEKKTDEKYSQNDRVEPHRGKQYGKKRMMNRLDYDAMVEHLRGKNHCISDDEVIYRVRRDMGPEWCEPAIVQDIPGLEGLQPPGDSGCTNQFLMVDCNIHREIIGAMYYVVRDREEKIVSFGEVDDRDDKAKVFRVAQWLLDKQEAFRYKADNPKIDTRHQDGKKREIEERAERARRKEWSEIRNC